MRAGVEEQDVVHELIYTAHTHKHTLAHQHAPCALALEQMNESRNTYACVMSYE